MRIYEVSNPKGFELKFQTAHRIPFDDHFCKVADQIYDWGFDDAAVSSSADTFIVYVPSKVRAEKLHRLLSRNTRVQML